MDTHTDADAVRTIEPQHISASIPNKLSPRMLVVDDHVLMQCTLRQWFEAQGFDVDVASNGRAAVDKCTATRYDVITMDIEMPVMNGVEATTAIRALYPDVPIIVLTGYLGLANEAARCGASAVVSKPVAPSELEVVVRRLMLMRSQDGPS